MKFSKTNKLRSYYDCYCYDVGIIVKVTGLFFDQGCGCGVLHLPNQRFYISNKATAVISHGYVVLSTINEKPLKEIPCNDPRVLYMYLWPFWKHNIGSDDEDPPVPTMEEARSWMSKAGIPEEPDSHRIYSNATAEYFGFYF